jgi:hypothetical protein
MSDISRINRSLLPSLLDIIIKGSSNIPGSTGSGFPATKDSIETGRIGGDRLRFLRRHITRKTSKDTTMANELAAATAIAQTGTLWPPREMV